MDIRYVAGLIDVDGSLRRNKIEKIEAMRDNIVSFYDDKAV